MIRKSIILFILIMHTICAGGRDGGNRYLKNGVGICLINGNIGPALNIEYGQSLNKNLYLVPRVLISSVIGERENPASESYDSYYDFGLGLQYGFSSEERIKIGLGVSAQLMRQIYLREYKDISANVVRDIVSLFDVFGTLYGSIDYAVIQKNSFDLGIDGILGEYNSCTVAIYMKFKS